MKGAYYEAPHYIYIYIYPSSFYSNLHKHPKYDGTTVVASRISLYQFNLGVSISGVGRHATAN